MSHGVVVVGAGQAGFQVAASLREAGWQAPITLIGEEDALPYQRPPLSKAYLAGKTDRDGLWLRPPAYLEEHRIALRRGVRAVAIDRTERRVHLTDGGVCAYDHLVLATGSRNRALPVPGADLSRVHQLRSLDDADALRAGLDGVRAIVVVGAGFIGLEFAAVAAERGHAVTVVEAANRMMARAVSSETAAWFAEAHARAGIEVRCGANVTAIEGVDGRAKAVLLADGTRIPADLVVIGIGVLANDALAKQAGLRASDGIEVDAFLNTDDPAISAIGDCARFPTRFARGLNADDRIRIESVQNAIDQARCLAARLTGRRAAFDAVPWFWSDQGRNKLQIAGLSKPDDESIARGDAAASTVLRFRQGTLCAVETINRPGDHMAARKVLAADIGPTPEEARTENFDFREFARKAP